VVRAVWVCGSEAATFWPPCPWWKWGWLWLKLKLKLW